MFLLQQGWGMLSLIEEYLEQHPDTGVILSPRVSEKDQMEHYQPKYSSIPNQEVLFDPHFYEPRTDLQRILSYPYFQNYDFQTQSFNISEFCEWVIDYQLSTLQLSTVILPGRYTNSLNDSWLQMHHDFGHIGSSFPELAIYSTIAIGPDVILNPDNFNTIIDEVINYPIDGIYFVFEHPNNDYFLNEEFIYVILDGILSMVLSDKRVILGYANQQSLVFTSVGVDYIASGNYRNVRAFDHLNSSDRDDDTLRKGIWYFDGNTFGEYRVQALSLAYRRGLQDFFGPSTEYTLDLLSSLVPTNIVWREPDAFRHYLELMCQYCQEIFTIPRNQRAQYLMEFFRRRRESNDNLASRGFNFGDRGFNNAVSDTLSALDSIISDRGNDLASL